MKHQTRKNKVICYTGVGARKNYKHTFKQFRKVAKKECRESKKYHMGLCPPLKNINRLVKYFGAIYTTPEECKDTPL